MKISDLTIVAFVVLCAAAQGVYAAECGDNKVGELQVAGKVKQSAVKASDSKSCQFMISYDMNLTRDSGTCPWPGAIETIVLEAARRDGHCPKNGAAVSGYLTIRKDGKLDEHEMNVEDSRYCGGMSSCSLIDSPAETAKSAGKIQGDVNQSRSPAKVVK